MKSGVLRRENAGQISKTFDENEVVTIPSAVNTEDGIITTVDKASPIF
jgi:hypothetical protein